LAILATLREMLLVRDQRSDTTRALSASPSGHRRISRKDAKSQRSTFKISKASIIFDPASNSTALAVDPYSAGGLANVLVWYCPFGGCGFAWVWFVTLVVLAILAGVVTPDGRLWFSALLHGNSGAHGHQLPRCIDLFSSDSGPLALFRYQLRTRFRLVRCLH